MIINALDQSTEEHREAVRLSHKWRQQTESPTYRDGPEHVILGGRQEGKTHLAVEWVLGANNRILIVQNERAAVRLRDLAGLGRKDPRFTPWRQLLNQGGGQRNIEYGIDETVDILTELLKLRENPHLVTIATAAPWQVSK